MSDLKGTVEFIWSNLHILEIVSQGHMGKSWAFMEDVGLELKIEREYVKL